MLLPLILANPKRKRVEESKPMVKNGYILVQIGFFIKTEFLPYDKLG
jgi:hypothetical protein